LLYFDMLIIILSIWFISFVFAAELLSVLILFFNS
jgi:hypothetical protein